MRDVKGSFHVDTKMPEALMRLFILTASVSIAVILSLTGFGINRIYSRHIIRNAEEDAVDISKALLEAESDVLISTGPTGKARLKVGKGEMVLFDQRIRRFLQAFNIVKIKIYDGESRIIYCTDPSLIGKIDQGNKGLKRALLGNNESKLENKDKVTDLVGERKFDLDVVETYVPVRTAAHGVIGSFEVYLDVTRYRTEIRTVTAMSVAVLAMILSLVFAPSFFLIRSGTLQLKDAQAELVRSEKLAMLGRIAGSMGNELRNPLGVMNNAVYFLRTVMPNADEPVREYLEIIGKEIDNSQRIISALLDLFLEKPLRPELIEIDELIRQTLESTSIPDIVRLRTDLPETLPVVRIDPLQIGQVLCNLVTNAVQAMPGGGELTVAARRVLSSEFKVLSSAYHVSGSNSELKTQNSELDRDFIEISITDSGGGIAPEHMDKLFQPLFTTKARGIGLGLAISQKVVEASGGRIEVASRPGEGTTFTVLLPLEAG